MEPAEGTIAIVSLKDAVAIGAKLFAPARSRKCSSWHLILRSASGDRVCLSGMIRLRSFLLCKRRRVKEGLQLCLAEAPSPLMQLGERKGQRARYSSL